ncbi:MAG: hypothetical protein ABIN61_04870 [candidate division WOR-3 bacterium]
MKLFSFIPLCGIGAGVISFLLFILFFKRIKAKRKNILGLVIHFLFVIIFALISICFLLLYVSLKGYENFAYNEPIFYIECPIKEKDWFAVKIVPKDSKKETKFYHLKGQQFVIDGQIIKWENFLVSLGMKPLYKITRLSGRYISIEDEKSKERTVYELGEETLFWRWLMRYGEKIPGIDAVYGNSSFKDAKENKRFTVYITNDSFVIKED